MKSFKESWLEMKQEFKKLTWLDWANGFFIGIFIFALMYIFKFIMVSSLVTWVMVIERYSDVLTKETLNTITKMIRLVGYSLGAMLVAWMGHISTKAMKDQKKKEKLKKEITEKVKENPLRKKG